MVIYKNNLKRMLSSKAKVFIVFFIPILFVLMFMSDNNDTQVKIVVFDKDQTPLTKNLIDMLKDKNKVIKTKETLVKDLLIDGQIDYVITFDQGFTQAILENKEAHINEMYFIEGGKIQPTKGYITSYIQIVKNIAKSSKSEVDFYSTLGDKGNYFTTSSVNIEEISTEESISGMGFMVQFILYMSIITAAVLLIDREKNILVRVATSPITRRRYMAENLLSYITVAILQIISIFIFYKLYMHMYFGKHFIYLLILMAIFSVVAIALSMVVVTFVKSEKVAYGIALVGATPLLMLGGCYFELSSMPDAVQKISKFLPTYWVMNGARELIINNNASSILTNYAVLLTFALTFFIISIVGVKNMAKN